MENDNVFVGFLLHKGLYDTQEVTKDNIDQLIKLINGEVNIDSYCVECNEKRVFHGIPIDFYWTDEDRDNGNYHEQRLAEEVQNYQKLREMTNTPRPGSGSDRMEKWTWIDRQTQEAARIMVFKFVCSMDNSHHLDFIVKANQGSLVKIGQYPSVADLEFPELKKYRKILSGDDIKGLRRAIGLFAQGIGAGSYVYLRRIFEHLVLEAQNRGIKDGVITQEKIERMRVVEKINVLSSYLPEILVNNSSIYGILSKGIHELSEEECIAYFPVLKDCIFLILEKWEEERKREESEKSLTASIAAISSAIK